jgi:hydrogenase maturation factor HypF (carbamoyltransferase family)
MDTKDTIKTTKATKTTIFEIEEIGQVKKKDTIIDGDLAQCPRCKKNTLKIDGGCIECLNIDCAYSKCDI